MMYSHQLLRLLFTPVLDQSATLLLCSPLEGSINRTCHCEHYNVHFCADDVMLYHHQLPTSTAPSMFLDKLQQGTSSICCVSRDCLKSFEEIAGDWSLHQLDRATEEQQPSSRTDSCSLGGRGWTLQETDKVTSNRLLVCISDQTVHQTDSTRNDIKTFSSTTCAHSPPWSSILVSTNSC